MALSPLEQLSLYVRRPWLVVAGLLLGLGGGAFYARHAQPKFESDTQILVIQKDSRLTSTENADLGVERGVSNEILGTHLQIITSPRVVRDAVRRSELLRLASLRQRIEPAEDALASRVLGFLSSLFGDDAAEPTPTMSRLDLEKAAVDYIVRNLNVRRGGNDAARDAQVLEVSFKHTSAPECATVLAAIIESYQDFLQELTRRMGNEAVQAIARASEKVQETVRRNEQQYESFLHQSPLLWRNGETVNPHQDQIVALETQLSELKVRESSLQSRLKTVRDALAERPEDASDMELLALIDQADFQRLSLLLQVERGDVPASAAGEFKELVQLQVELQRQLLTLGENHPKVHNTRQLIAELEQYLNANSRSLQSLREDDGVNPRRLVNTYARLLRTDVTDIQQRIGVLQDLIQQHHDKAKALARFEVKYENLDRTLQRSLDLYDTVAERLRQIDITKDFGVFATEQISPVEEGVEVWPNTRFVLALGAVLGLGLGWGLGLLVDLSDRSFRSKTDIERELELPVLAQIPPAKFRRRHVARGSSADASLYALHRPDSDFAESFRGLRTAVSYRGRRLPRPVVLLTSPTACDGKSTVVSNLAVSLARAGKRVLVVDCDLRRPSLHKLFGMPNDVGLSSVLVGQCTLEEATRPGEVPNLTVIPSGPIPPNPAELLALPGFEQLLRAARQQHDYVLIDSPPVLGLSDALAIAAQVDLTLLTIRVTKDSRYTARRSRDELLSHGARLVGLVVNDELHESTAYYYYRSYKSDLRVVGDSNANVASV